MKGWFVFIIFVTISVISCLIAIYIFASNVSKSIVASEEASKQALTELFDGFYIHNNNASVFFDAASFVPGVNENIINSFNENISKVNAINTNIEIIQHPVTFQNYQYLQSQIQNDINGIIRIANNYPSLRTNEYFAEARKNLSKSQENVDELIVNYNNNVQRYNKLTLQLPTSIIAGIMKKFEILQFKNATELESSMGVNYN